MSVSISSTVPTPTADGVYPYEIPPQAGIPAGQQTSLIARIGTGNWGPVDTPQYYNTLSQALNIWGAEATLPNSLVAATQSATPEGTNFADVRVTDGTDTAATGNLVDASAGIVATLVAKYSGTDGNTITATLNLISGSMTGGTPMVQLVVAIANRASWTSPTFSAGSSGYVKATFIANLQAAIAGSSGAGACPYIGSASAGSSALAPVTGTANTFTGGDSGVASITSAVLIGADGTTNRTGIYALRGVGMNIVHVVGLTDLTQAQTLATFAQSESCIALIAIATGTSTTTAISDKNTANASNRWLVVTKDWLQQNDAVDGTGAQYYEPSPKIAAGISQLQPWQYPGNKPYIGFANIIGTERTSTPYSTAELGLLEQSGILIITRPISRGNVYGLAHGMTSDGVTPISDTRMLNQIAVDVTAILGQFVGESQGPPPAAGAADTDPTRNNARNAITAYFAQKTNPNAPQIANYNLIMDGTNNTAASVAAGYLYDEIQVTTLAGIRFILTGLQIGQTVQIVAA